MWPNPQFPAGLVIFTEETLNEKLHFLCSVTSSSTNVNDDTHTSRYHGFGLPIKHQIAFFDVKVFDLNAKQYENKNFDELFDELEEKR